MNRYAPAWLVAVVALLAAGAPRTAAAQVTAGADVTVATRYVWRGITRVRGPVIQPGGWVALAAGNGYLAAGAWASVELREAVPGDATLLAEGERGLGETDLWISYSARRGFVDWVAGASHYRVGRELRHPGAQGRYATTELWLLLSAPRARLIPRAGAWLDVDRVRGRYYELAVDYPFSINPLAEPFGSLFLTVEVGISDGMRARAPGNAGYFQRNGITHVELAGSVTLDLAHVLPGSLHAAGHYHIGRDPATWHIGAPGSPSGRRRGWRGELSLSVATRTLRE